MPQQQLAPVSKDRHANKYWNKYKTFEFAAQEHLAPLVVAELPRAVKHFTMAFVQAGESYQLMGVLSLTPGQNMYVHPDGRWIGEYVLSYFRGYPFRLAKPPGQDNLVLCVDEGSGLVSDTEGEPFFDDQGEINQAVKDSFNFLTQVEKSRMATNNMVKALADAEVIREWPLKIKVGEETRNVSGLFCIDEQKLNSLEDAQFLTLRKAGALPLAYAQLMSMDNIQILEKLNQMRQKAAEPELDLEDVDGLNFDWDKIKI